MERPEALALTILNYVKLVEDGNLRFMTDREVEINLPMMTDFVRIAQDEATGALKNLSRECVVPVGMGPGLETKAPRGS